MQHGITMKTKKKNKLVEASFYKKEGFMLWVMYYIFFSLGYLYGNKGESFIEVSFFWANINSGYNIWEEKE